MLITRCTSYLLKKFNSIIAIEMCLGVSSIICFKRRDEHKLRVGAVPFAELVQQ